MPFVELVSYFLFLMLLVNCLDVLIVLTSLVHRSGHSSYTTYLQNPTTIDNAMTAVGATKLLDLGKADAKQIGETSQANTIIKWKEDLLAPLAKSLAAKPSEELDLEEVQKSAIDIVCKIDPDYVPPGGRKGGAIPMPLMVLALIALIAALVMSGVIELPN